MNFLISPSATSSSNKITEYNHSDCGWPSGGSRLINSAGGVGDEKRKLASLRAAFTGIEV